MFMPCLMQLDRIFSNPVGSCGQRKLHCTPSQQPDYVFNLLNHSADLFNFIMENFLRKVLVCCRGLEWDLLEGQGSLHSCDSCHSGSRLSGWQ